MPVQPLTLTSLRNLDMGKIEEALALHLGRAAADCEDRPADPSPRKIVMTIAVSPQSSPEGNLEDVKAQVFVESRVPSHRTRVYSLGVRRIAGRGATFTFNSDAPDNVNQGTFFEDDRGE